MNRKDQLLDDELSPVEIKPVAAFSPVLVFVLAFILAFGVLFRIQNWPMGNISITMVASILMGHIAMRTFVRKFDVVDFAIRLVAVLGLLFLLVWFYDFSSTVLIIIIGTIVVSAIVEYIVVRNHQRGEITQRRD